MYCRFLKWCVSAGTIVDENSEDSEFAREVSSQRYTRTVTGNKIKLMSKKDMKKNGIKSTNISDAGALTMLRSLDEESQESEQEEETDFDPHEPLWQPKKMTHSKYQSLF